jgi:hypothetical protein
MKYILFSAIALMTAAAAHAANPAKTLLDCANAGDDAGLESLAIYVRPDLKTGAEVTVSGPGDAIETYHYQVVEKQPGKVGGSIQYQSPDGGKKFNLSFCSTCAPMDKKGTRHASVSFVAPKNAQIFPGVRLTYKSLACTEQFIAE